MFDSNIDNVLFFSKSTMAINEGYIADDDNNADTSKNESNKNRQTNQPDEGTLLSGPQTYFADEKITVPDIDRVCNVN